MSTCLILVYLIVLDELLRACGQGCSGGEHCLLMRHDRPWLHADERTQREVRRQVGEWAHVVEMLFFLFNSFGYHFVLNDVFRNFFLPRVSITWTLCYKTYYGRKLQSFVSKMSFLCYKTKIYKQTSVVLSAVSITNKRP